MEKSKNVQSRRIISWPLEMLLRILGIWPGIPYGPYCKVFWLIIIVINTTFQFLFLIYRTSINSFDIFMYAFVCNLAMNIKFIKIAIFWCNQRIFNEIWETISINWKRNNEYKSAIGTTGKMQMPYYLPNCIVAFNSLSVIITTFGNLSGIIGYDETSNGTRPYVIPTHLPFDNINHSVYLIIIFQQLFYVWIMAATSATINSVLIILMLYLGDQIDVICACLMKMPQEDNNHKAQEIIIKEMVKKHQSVILFSEKVEAIYTYIALMLIVLNVFITCGLAFIIVKAIESPNFVKIVRKNLLFYCVINIEMFVFCLAGEYMSAKSRQIGDAAYSSPWYESKFHSRIILFMIMRSQNQLTLTMGKFAHLSFELFSSILKTSASYLSVLLAMY